MKGKRLLALLLCFSITLPLFPQPVAHVQAQTNETSSPNSTLSSGYIIKTKPSEDVSLLSLSDFEGLNVTPIDSTLLLAEIKPGYDEQAITEALQQDPRVSYAEPNYLFHVASLTSTPNDPGWGQQWHMDEYQIDPVSAWGLVYERQETPQEVIVALVDTGVDATHQDLQSHLLPGWNAIDASTATEDDSRIGHGTHLAGIIAADSNNQLGISGLAGDLPISVLPIKALDAGGVGTMANIARGIKWAADQGAQVINLSFGAHLPDYPKTLADAIVYAQGKGTLIIAAAGNNGTRVSDFYPACLPGVISVGATGENNIRAPFNNQYPTFLAPGIDIYSTLPENRYGKLSGTSQAAAVVSSCAALLITAYPNETAAKYKAAIYAGRSYCNAGTERNYIVNADVPIDKMSQTLVSSDDVVTLISPAYVYYDNPVRLTGNQEIVTYVGDSSVLSRIDLYVIQASSPYEELLLKSIPNEEIPESSTITHEFDTTTLPDGVYDVEVRAYGMPNAQNEVYLEGSDYARVILANTPINGLSIEIIKPDGTPASGAHVTVHYPQPSLEYPYNIEYRELYNGPADQQGRLFISSSEATAGSVFLITAMGTEPNFFYYKLVEAQQSVLLDHQGCTTLTLKAGIPSDTDPQEMVPLSGMELSLEPLEKNLPNAIIPDMPFSFYKSDSMDNKIPFVLLDGNGETECYITPGFYNLKLVHPQQKVYFLDYDREICSDNMQLSYCPSIDEYTRLQFQPEPYGDGIGDSLLSASCSTYLENGSNYFYLPDLSPGETFSLLGGTLNGSMQIEYRTNDYNNASYVFKYTYQIQPQQLTPGNLLLQQDHTFTAKVEQEPTQIHVIGEYAVLKIGCFDSFGNRLSSTTRRASSSSYASYLYPSIEILDQDMISLYQSKFYNSDTFHWLIPENLPASTLTAQFSYDDGFVKTLPATLRFNIDEPSEKPPVNFVLSVDMGSYSQQVTQCSIQMNFLAKDGTYITNPYSVSLDESFRLEYDSYENFAADSEFSTKVQLGDPFRVLVFGTMLVGQETARFYFSQQATFTEYPMSITIAAPENLIPVRLIAHDYLYDETAEDLLNHSMTDVRYGIYQHIDQKTIGFFFDAENQIDPLFVLPQGTFSIFAQRENRDYDPDFNLNRSYYLYKKINLNSSTTEIHFNGSLDATSTLHMQVDEIHATDYSPLALALYPEDLSFSPVYDMMPPQYYYSTFDDVPKSVIQVTPGSYRMEGVIARAHMDNDWSYWIQKDEPLSLNPASTQFWTVGQPCDADDTLLQLPAPSIFQPNTDIPISVRFGDGKGNHLVGIGIDVYWTGSVIPVSLASSDEVETESEFSAQSHLEPAPVYKIIDPNGNEILEIRNHLHFDRRLLTWCNAMSNQQQHLATVRYLAGPSTYHGAQFRLEATAVGGAYKVQLILAAAPDLVSYQSTTFTLEAKHRPPILQSTSAYSNALLWEVTGSTIASAEMTWQLTYGSESAIEFQGGQSSELGSISYQISENYLTQEGLYSLRAQSSIGELTSDWSEPIEILIDRTPPAAVSNFNGEALDSTTVSLTCGLVANDSGSPTNRYRITRDGVIVNHFAADSSPLQWLDTGLVANTTYEYSIAAIDQAGNVGLPERIYVKTLTGKDAIPPSSPTEVSVMLTEFSAFLSWLPSHDNIAVAGYNIERLRKNEAVWISDAQWQVTPDESLVFTDPDLLNADTMYCYTVQAFDLAENLSEFSPSNEILTRTLRINQIRWSAARQINGALKTSLPDHSSPKIDFQIIGDFGRQAFVELSWIQSQDNLNETKQEQISLVEALDINQNGTGVYKGSWVLPTNVRQVLLAKGILKDPESLGVYQYAERFPLMVEGHLDITVPENESELLKGAILKVWSSSLNTGAQRSIQTPGTFSFQGLYPALDYTITLTSVNQLELVRQENVAVVGNKTSAQTVTPVYPATLALKIVNSSSEPMRNCEIRVFDNGGTLLVTGSSNHIGDVPRLSYNFKAGTHLSLQIIPPTNQILNYDSIINQRIVLSDGTNLVQCVLPLRPRAEISGTVELQATPSQPLSDASLRVYQTLNNIEHLVGQAKTTAAGEYRITVIPDLPLRIVMTHRLITAKEYTVEQGISVGVNHVFPILCPVEKTLGVHLMVQEFSEPEYDMPIDWRVSVHLRLQIINKGQEGKPKNLSYSINGINDHLLPLPNAEPGDHIVVEADGVECGMNKGSVEVILDENTWGVAEVHLKKLGLFQTQVVDINGNFHTGFNRYVELYQWRNDRYEFIRTLVSSKELVSTPYLAENKYAFVFHWDPLPDLVHLNGVWQSFGDDYLAVKTYAEQLNETGQPHGFVLEDVQLSHVKQDLGLIHLPIPQGVANGYFRGTNGNELVFSKDQAAPGTLVTLRGSYSKAASPELGNLKLFFAIPKGTEIITDSIVVHRTTGSQQPTFVVKPDAIEVRFGNQNAEALEGTIYYSVRLPNGNLQGMLFAKMWAEYTNPRLNKEEIHTATITVPAVSIVAPPEITEADQAIVVSGSTSPFSLVVVYDGSEKIAETRSNEAGYWSSTVVLPDRGAPAHHYLRAEVKVQIDAGDITPPTWPTNASLTIDTIVPESITLHFPAAQDERDVRLYVADFYDTENQLLASRSLPNQEHSGMIDWNITDLTQGETYRVLVRASDSSLNWSEELVSTFSTLNPDTNPPVWSNDSGLQLTNRTFSSASLQWPLAMDDTAMKEIRVHATPAVGSLRKSAILTTDATTYNVTGLSRNVSYTFRVEAIDVYGNSNSLSTTYWIPNRDTSVPTWPSGSTFTTTSVLDTEAHLQWTPAEDDMQILRYRIEQWNGSGWSGYSTSYQSQSLLNGLAAETTYRFRIFAEDLSYNTTVDFLEVGFTTTARDLTAPMWPAQVTYALSEQTDTSFIMEWPEAYDVSGIRLYQIYIWDAINQEYRTFSTSNRSWHANGFARGDIVTGYITAEDQRGNRISRADGIPFTVQIAPEDTTPPSWPVGSTMTIHEVAPTLVELSWSSANTTAEQAGMSDSLLYIIRALDTQQNEVRSTSVGQNIQQWAIGPLDPGETYTIKIEARDRYGNTSTDGPQAIVQTPQTDDSAPWWPVDPSFRVYRIQQNNEGTYHVMFEWSQATDFNMRYYELTAVDENNNAPASSPTTTQQTSWHLWGMQPGRTYTVQVVAVDSYGHRSQPLTTAVRIPGIADSMNLLAVEQPLISSKETLTLLSEPVKVTYDPQAVHITKVTMQQTDGRRVDFTPVGKFPYVFVPGMNFRFDVEFDKPERVEEMRIHAANGAELGGAVGASGGAIPLLGAVAVSGGLNGMKTIPGAIYVSTVQTPQSFAMSTIPTFNEAAIRSGLPSAYAYATMAEDTTYDDGDAETATVRKTGTLSDPRLKLETTATYRPLYEHTEASSDIVRIAAGGVPLYDFSWSHSVQATDYGYLVSVSVSAVVEIDTVKITDPNLLQVLSAAGAGGKIAQKIAITIKGDHMLTDGLNYADFVLSLMGADDLSEYQKSLDDLANDLSSDCPASDRQIYRDIIEDEKEMAMWRTVTKNVMSLGSIALGVVIPGLGFAIGSYVVGKLTEAMIDAEQDDRFNEIQNRINMDDFCKPKKREWKKDLVADPTWILDPSGIAYEVTLDQPVLDATATLYEDRNGTWTLWDATWYEQTNPLLTDTAGRYAWDVPEGTWKVILTKGGYAASESPALVVPPPHTDVNLPMVRTTQPQVQDISVLPLGQGLRIVFDQYMKISSLNNNVIQAFDANGAPMNGNALAQGPISDPLAPAVLLTRELHWMTDRTLIQDEALQITLAAWAQSYNGLTLTNDFTQNLIVQIPISVTGVRLSTSNLSLAPVQQAQLSYTLEPENANETGVTWQSSHPEVATVSSTGIVTAISVGQATITVTTNDGTYTASSVVTVALPESEPEEPPAIQPPLTDQPIVDLTQDQAFTFFENTVWLHIPAGALPTDMNLQTEQISDPLTTLDKQIYTQASPMFLLKTGGIAPTSPLTLTLAYCHVCLLGGDPRLTGIYRQDDENQDLYHYVGGVVDSDAHTVMADILEPGRYVILSHDPQFNDLSSHWAETDCSILAARNVLQGTGDGHFEPDRAITRAEFTRLLLNMDRILQVSTQNQQHSMTFGDVQPQDWFYTDITAAAANGWVSGSYGNFRPNQTISRQEMAVMLQNMLGMILPQVPMTPIQGLFSDANNTAPWAQEALTLAVSLGLIKGMDGTLQPEGEATRAQAASLILRCLEMLGQITKPVSQQGILRANSDENLPFEMTDTDGNPIYVLPQNEGVRQQLAALVLSGQTVTVEGIWSRESTIALHGRLLKVWSLK